MAEVVERKGRLVPWKLEEKAAALEANKAAIKNRTILLLLLKMEERGVWDGRKKTADV